MFLYVVIIYMFLETNISLPRILCWVMCDPSELKRVEHVKATWIKRCDVYLFMSSETNDQFPTIGLDVKAGRDHIGSKSKAAWTYIYRNYLHKADFFIKTDPDTYLVVENLKLYMSKIDPDVPAFFGHRFSINHDKKPLVYYSGGPGQLLSRGAVEKLVTKAFNETTNCMPDGQGNRIFYEL